MIMRETQHVDLKEARSHAPLNSGEGGGLSLAVLLRQA